MRNDILNFSNETERERLLHTILYFLSMSNSKVKNQCRESGVYIVYEEPEIGDLVIGGSGEIGYVVDMKPDENEFLKTYTIQVLGTDKLIDWKNEYFRRITGVNPMYLLTGEKRKFKEFVQRTFAEHEDISYMHYFSTIEFQGDEALITVRKRFVGGSYRLKLENYGKIKTPEKLRRLLIKAGWGSKEDKK